MALIIDRKTKKKEKNMKATATHVAYGKWCVA